MKETLAPIDHAEAVAHFRASVIASLSCRDLTRGDLAAELRALSRTRFRAPGSALTRSYAVSTLERWYYAFRSGGINALKPKPRSDRGHAKALTPEQRALLLAIREDSPGASVPLILRTLVAEGRLEQDAISAATLRRLYRDAGLDRVTLRSLGKGSRDRRRWSAEYAGQLWHADVCHGATMRINGRPVPLRIHAILDDVSRAIVAIAACDNEREVEMLKLTAEAIRLHGKPATLYLDNGSTYRGETLRTACSRLSIRLVHAKPYDPQARGKMERFWRTLREGCLDSMGEMHSLHDVQIRILAFVDMHYMTHPHGSLMGKTPEKVYEARTRHEVSEDALKEALTVRSTRRVRGDGTLSIGGVDWEVEQGFLAGHKVTIGRSFLDPGEAPWIEREGSRQVLTLVDPKRAGASKRRTRKRRTGIDAASFAPADALLNKMMGRSSLPCESGKGGRP